MTAEETDRLYAEDQAYRALRDQLDSALWRVHDVGAGRDPDDLTVVRKRSDEENRAGYLAQLRAVAALRQDLDGKLTSLGRWAVHYGASYTEAGAAADMSRQAAHKRFRAPDEWRGERSLPQPRDDGGEEPGPGQVPQDGDRV